MQSRRSNTGAQRATGAHAQLVDEAYQGLLATCGSIAEAHRGGHDVGPEAYDAILSWWFRWLDLREARPEGVLGDDAWQKLLAGAALASTGALDLIVEYTNFNDGLHVHDAARRVLERAGHGHNLVACLMTGVYCGDVELATGAAHAIAHDGELTRLAWQVLCRMDVPTPQVEFRRPHRGTIRAAIEVLSASPALQWTWQPSPHLAQGQQWALLCSVAWPPVLDALHELGEPIPRGAAVRALAPELHDPGAAVASLHTLWSVGSRGAHARDLEQVDRGVSTGADTSRGRYLREHRDELKEIGVLAFDLSQMIQNARRMHRAGVLDAATTWQWIRTAAGDLLREYDSWEGFARSYVLGAQLAAGTDRVYADTRVGFYLYDPRSPWHVVPWGIDPAQL